MSRPSLLSRLSRVSRFSPRTLATAAGVVIGAIPFFAVLLGVIGPGGLAAPRLDRTAVGLGYASNFFDIQARALLEGHLWIPDDAIGIEGFVIDGRTYMYFPPIPALVRLPIMLVTHEFDGRLTVLSMGIAWVLLAVMASRLLWLVRDCLIGDADAGSEPSRLAAAGAAIVLGGALGGTVLTFDASLPWVYHEVYLWAVALVVGALYWLIRVARDPQPVAIRWLGAFALAAILTRTPGGYAVCGATLLTAAWLGWGRRSAGPAGRRVTLGQAGRRRTVALVGAAAGIPLAASVALNMWKFHHPYLFPLQDQLWTQVNAHRREALAVNGGSITGPQFFLTSLVNYFRPDGIRFVPYFPWIELPAEPARAYGGAFLDQYYRTGSITAFMPLPFLLTVVAVVALTRRRRGGVAGEVVGGHAGVVPVRLAALGGLGVCFGVMGYGYVCYRYTSEFVPGLIIGSFAGLWALTPWLERRRPRVGWSLVSAMGALTAFAVAANVLTAVTMTSFTARGETLVHYVAAQERSAGDSPAYAALITKSADLPAGGHADDLHIRGDCDGLYLHTGDAYEPWLLVAERDTVLDVTPGASLAPGLVPLFDVGGAGIRRVFLEIAEGAGRLGRLVSTGDGPMIEGPWFALYPDTPIRIGARTRTDLGYVEISATMGGGTVFVPQFLWDENWTARPALITAYSGDLLGVARRLLPAADPPVCRAVLGHAATS